jgi:hypothetical protein
MSHGEAFDFYWPPRTNTNNRIMADDVNRRDDAWTILARHIYYTSIPFIVRL